MPALPLPDPSLTDGEVALRPWHDADARALAALCRDETIVRWTNVPADYTKHMARARVTEAEAERRAGRGLILAVVDARTDDVLGACDLRVTPGEPSVAEVGYMLAEHARGKGVMIRAVQLLSRWAINRLGIDRVLILIHPENRASSAVAEGAGFKREGVLPCYREKKGNREDRVVFSMRAGER
jgi:RimJ/RimL family protein N-acetyltransferase